MLKPALIHLLPVRRCIYLWLGLILLCGKAPMVGQGTLLVPPSATYNDFVYQDDKGFTWISSLEGWFRTDGTSYEQFQPTTEGYDIYVQSTLYPDEEGGLWYTGFNGLHRINPVSKEVDSYSFPDGLKEGYRAFYLDCLNQELWLRVEESLCLFNLETRTFTATDISTTLYGSAVKPFPGSTEPAVIIGCPWYDGPGVSVISRDKPTGQWKKKEFRLPGDETDAYTSSALFLTEDQVLLGTETGLVLFDLKLEAFTPLKSKDNNPMPTGGITDMLWDTSNSILYVAEGEKRLWAFPVNESKCVNWAAGNIVPSVNAPTQLNADSRGALFVTDRTRGLERTVHTQGLFKSVKLSQPLVDLQIGPDREAYGLAADGTCYQLSANKVILTADQEGNDYQRLHYSSNSWVFLKGTSIKNRSFGKGTPGIELPISRIIEPVLAVHESGDMVIASTTGLQLYDVNTFGKSRLIPTGLPLSGGWEVDFMAYPKPGGPLLLAYNSNELWVCDWRADSLAVREKIKIGYDILSVAPTGQNGRFWVGTAKGLFEVYGDAAKAVILDSRVAMTPSIRSIIPVNDSLLLLGTDKGVMAFNLLQTETKLYTVYDGLPSGKLVPGASGLDRDERCWFLIDGRAYFSSPEMLYGYKPPLPLPYPSALWVNDIPRPDLITKASQEMIILPNWKNNLQFQLNNLGLDHPEATTIQFRLLSRDSSWQEQASGTTIAFNNLVAGEYTLELISVNKNRITRQGKSISIRIKKALHQQFIFQFGILFFVGGLIYFIAYLINKKELQKIKNEHAKTQALSEERMRISRQLHDDLGSDLTTIHSLISSHKYLKEQNADETPLDLDELQSIVKNADSNMREIVWAIDDQQCYFHHLVEQLSKLVRSRSAGRREVMLDLPTDSLDYIFTSEQKRNIYLIFKEGMQNIDKHAPLSSVCNLRIRTGKTELEIKLTDNGPGLTATARQKTENDNSGYGTANMKYRAQQIGANLKLSEAVPHGTTLLFQIPLQKLQLPKKK